jgi:hypothetical protein
MLVLGSVCHWLGQCSAERTPTAASTHEDPAHLGIALAKPVAPQKTAENSIELTVLEIVCDANL